MKSHPMRRIAALALMLVMLCAMTACGGNSAPAAEQTASVTTDNVDAQLISLLGTEAENILVLGDADLNMYKNAEWPNVYLAMPDSFDLRDLGVVPEIRNQGNWGTCWGFAAIAAS